MLVGCPERSKLLSKRMPLDVASCKAVAFYLVIVNGSNTVSCLFPIQFHKLLPLITHFGYNLGLVQVALHQAATLAHDLCHAAWCITIGCQCNSLLLLLDGKRQPTSARTLWPAVMVSLWHWCLLVCLCLVPVLLHPCAAWTLVPVPMQRLV